MIVVGILLCLAISLMVSRTFQRSAWSPFGVAAFIVAISLLWLAITILPVFPLRDETWLALTLTWAVAALGTIVGALAGDAIGGGPDPTDAVVPERVVRVMALVALAGAIRFAYIVVNLTGLDAVTGDATAVRALLTMSDDYSTGKLTVVFEGVTYAAAVLGGMLAARKPASLFAYVPILAGIIHDVLFVGRSHTFAVIVYFTSALLLSGVSGVGRQLLRHAAPLILAGLGFLGILTFVGQYRSESPDDVPLPSDALRMLEFSHNWYLFDGLVYTGSPMTMGANTFIGVYRALFLLGAMETDPKTVSLGRDSVALPLGNFSNKYTAAADIFADYGLAGLVVTTFLGAAMVALIFRLRGRASIWSTGLLAACYHAAVFILSGLTVFSLQVLFALLTLGVVALTTFARSRARAPGPALRSNVLPGAWAAEAPVTHRRG